MKKFAISYILISLNFLILFAACEKDVYKELEGTWIQEMGRGVDDGESYRVYQKIKFDKDEVTVTIFGELDGEVVKTASCQGEWKFIDGKSLKYIKAKGIVEIEFDLSTFRYQDNDGEDEETRELLIDYFKSNNEELEKAHKKDRYYGSIIIDIKKNVITLEDSMQWVREDYEEDEMEEEAEERSERDIEFEEDNNYERESEVKSKKSGPSPLFLEHVIVDYYECVFDDDGKKFYLTFFEENDRGAYQTPSGKVYLLYLKHQNDTRDKVVYDVETLNDKKTNMEFDIDVTFYPDISGKFIEGSDVYDFTGTACPYEMP